MISSGSFDVTLLSLLSDIILIALVHPSKVTKQNALNPEENYKNNTSAKTCYKIQQK